MGGCRATAESPGIWGAGVAHTALVLEEGWPKSQAVLGGMGGGSWNMPPALPSNLGPPVQGERLPLPQPPFPGPVLESGLPPSGSSAAVKSEAGMLPQSPHHEYFWGALCSVGSLTWAGREGSTDVHPPHPRPDRRGTHLQPRARGAEGVGGAQLGACLGAGVSQEGPRDLVKLGYTLAPTTLGDKPRIG